MAYDFKNFAYENIENDDIDVVVGVN